MILQLKWWRYLNFLCRYFTFRTCSSPWILKYHLLINLIHFGYISLELLVMQTLSHYHYIERITRSISGSFRLNETWKVSISVAQRRMCWPIFRCINNYEQWWWKVFVLLDICLYLYLQKKYPLRIATKLWYLIYSLPNATREHKTDGCN